MKTYTFDELSAMEPAQVEKIKAETAERIAAIMQKKYADIAAILFYQEEIDKVQP